MQRVLDATLKYCFENKMTMNVFKTNYRFVREVNSGDSQVFLFIETQLRVTIHYATSESCSSSTTRFNFQSKAMSIELKKHY